MAKPGTDRDGAMVEKTTGKKVTQMLLLMFFSTMSGSDSNINVLVLYVKPMCLEQRKVKTLHLVSMSYLGNTCLSSGLVVVTHKYWVTYRGGDPPFDIYLPAACFISFSLCRVKIKSPHLPKLRSWTGVRLWGRRGRRSLPWNASSPSASVLLVMRSGTQTQVSFIRLENASRSHAPLRCLLWLFPETVRHTHCTAVHFFPPGVI